MIGILRGQYESPAFGLRVGKSNVRNVMSKQLSVLREDTTKYGDQELPTLLGETGIPMNLDEGAAFNQNGAMWRNYSSQVEALDAILAVCSLSSLHSSDYIHH